MRRRWKWTLQQEELLEEYGEYLLLGLQLLAATIAFAIVVKFLLTLPVTPQ